VVVTLCVNVIYYVCLATVTGIQDGSTMLMEAAKGGHFDTMSLLLDWPTSSSSTGHTVATSTDTANKVDILLLIFYSTNGIILMSIFLVNLR